MLAVTACISPCFWAAAAAAEPGEPIKAVTAPSEDLTLAFVVPGRIDKVLVQEGRQVQRGEALVQLDDSLERMERDILKARADNLTALKAAQVTLARKQDILKKVQKAYTEKAAPEREMEEATTDAVMAELSLELEQFKHEQDKARLREAELRLGRMRLTSPTDGRVERLVKREGETVDALAGVLRIVRVQPLWIDVPVPLAQARGLKAGMEARVSFADAPAGAAPAEAKVIRIASVADAASQTLEVRLELANPSARPAGEQVTVAFPPAPATGQ